MCEKQLKAYWCKVHQGAVVQGEPRYNINKTCKKRCNLEDMKFNPRPDYETIECQECQRRLQQEWEEWEDVRRVHL